MPKLTLTLGLPGSGKSTWAKEEIKNSKGGTVGITKDDLRLMFCDTKKREKLVLITRDGLTKSYLKEGLNVIWHDTNFNPIHVARAKEIAKEHNSEVTVKVFGTSIEECIRRDLIRPNSVGEKVIRDMYNQYLKPMEEPTSKMEHNPVLPDCYIFDIDGTLALKSPERGYYEWDKVGLDLPNMPVVKMLNGLSDRLEHIFIFSGCDEICKTQTKVWLMSKTHDKTNTIDKRLFMRPQGNQEDDTIIKKRMYEENIKSKYNVLGIFDDRPKVVRMWQSLGLPVFAIGDQTKEF